MIEGWMKDEMDAFSIYKYAVSADAAGKVGDYIG